MNGDISIRLDPVNKKEWKNPQLQELEEEIQKDRQKRVEERLSKLKEERLIFSNARLDLKEDELKEVKIDVTYKSKTETLVFLSPKDHDRDFYFDQTTNFNHNSLKLQGMCLDSTDTCHQIGVQISYIHKKLKITEQFIVNSKTADQLAGVEPEEIDDSVEGLDTTEPKELDSEDENKDTPPGAVLDSEPEIKDEKPEVADTAPSSLSTPKSTDGETLEIDLSATKPTQPTRVQQPNSLSAPTNPDDLSSLDTSPAAPLDKKALLIDSENKSPAPQLSSISPRPPSSPKIKDSKIDIDSTLRPPKPAQKPTALQSPAAPDSLAGVDTSPAEIPVNQNDTTSEPLSGENSPKLLTGDGQIIFPDLSENDEKTEAEKEVTEEFNVNSAEVTIIKPEENSQKDDIQKDDADEKETHDDLIVDLDPKDPTPPSTEDSEGLKSSLRPVSRPKNFTSLQGDKALLEKIQNHRFKQSRGYYSYHTVRGHIKNASQLNRRMEGAVVNPRRRARQYSSGMLKSVLEYAAKKLQARYPDSPLCINDLSAKKGGKLGGHGSHRNGLDGDISLPSSANKCRGSFFQKWSNLKNRDAKFMERNWFLINTLLETKRVHVLFTNSQFVRAMCKYVKENTSLSKSARNKIFKKLDHEDGHDKHFHVRLQCNKQNPGCVTQGSLPGSTCN